MKVTKRVEFSYGHVLPKHKGRCSNPHGHNAVLEVTVTGPIMRDGMVIDFGDLKDIMKDVVEPLHHAWIFGRDDPVEMFELWEEMHWKRVYLSAANATAEEIAYYIHGELSQHFIDEFTISVLLSETSDSWVEFA